MAASQSAIDTTSPPKGRGSARTVAHPSFPAARKNFLARVEEKMKGFATASAIDLRAMWPDAPIYDQFWYGSCVANSVCWALGFGWMMLDPKPKAPLNPSRMHLWYMLREAYEAVDYPHPHIPFNDGGYVMEGLDAIHKNCICKEDDWPYGEPVTLHIHDPLPKHGNALLFDTQKVMDKGLPVAVRYAEIGDPMTGADSERRDITGANINTNVLLRVKHCIQCRHPLVFGFQEYKRTAPPDDLTLEHRGNYDNEGRFREPPVNGPDPSEVHQGGHEMVLVGFKDQPTPQNGGGYFLVRNSWGSHNKEWDKPWADPHPDMAGHFWLPYAWLRYPKYVDDAFALQVQWSGFAQSGMVEPSAWKNPPESSWAHEMVDFKGSFRAPPTVITGLSRIDLPHGRKLQLATTFEEVTEARFKSWHFVEPGQTAFKPKMSWLALPENEMQFETGVISTLGMPRSTDGNHWGSTKFSTTFKNTPQVVMWLYEAHVDGDHRYLQVRPSNYLDEKGFGWAVLSKQRNVWPYCNARARWLAIDTKDTNLDVEVGYVGVSTGQQDCYPRNTVKFKKRFKRPPAVFIACNQIWCEAKYNLRLVADEPKDITRDGFTVQCGNWVAHENNVVECLFTWIAIV